MVHSLFVYQSALAAMLLGVLSDSLYMGSLPREIRQNPYEARLLPLLAPGIDIGRFIYLLRSCTFAPSNDRDDSLFKPDGSLHRCENSLVTHLASGRLRNLRDLERSRKAKNGAPGQ